MTRIVECVPNFSEGRRREVVEELIETIAAVPGVTLLDSEMDADHNRSVLTFAGDPEPVMEAAFRAVQRASERIDLNQHRGEHPRMGAADVVPFVPVQGITLDECAELARQVGERIGRELAIPVFLYEAAATRPERVNLADVRRGEFEGLRELIGKDASRTPDFGPGRIHPSAGAIAVGARRFLVAFNANLNTSDVRVAKAVASAIREQSGGLKNVRALGFSIEGGRRAQVSMNLINTEATPIHRVLDLVRSEAARHGATVAGCEVVGLVPQSALLAASEHALQLEGFRRDQVLELRLSNPPFSGGVHVAEFLEQVSSATPTPGGGTVAAFAGALGASLAIMVVNLSVGKKKYAAHEADLKDARRAAEDLRARLLSLARQDSEAFEAVVRARRTSLVTAPAGNETSPAQAEAELRAARVPLETARCCLSVLELAERVARFGNVNAASDSGVAGLLAAAAAEGALLNVQINLKSLPDNADKNDIQSDLHRVREALGSAALRCREAVQNALMP
jgi:glutamate formiminotransferase/formiminotetrahydrofolate cyclodeaminase